MIKVFNYWESKKGWVPFESYEAARLYVEETFDDYWLMDKDNCVTCFMEIYKDGEYEVWCGEFGSWTYRDSDDEDFAPYKTVYYGTRSDFSSDLKFTTLDPTKDYILL